MNLRRSGQRRHLRLERRPELSRADESVCEGPERIHADGVLDPEGPDDHPVELRGLHRARSRVLGARAIRVSGGGEDLSQDSRLLLSRAEGLDGNAQACDEGGEDSDARHGRHAVAAKELGGPVDRGRGRGLDGAVGEHAADVAGEGRGRLVAAISLG